MPKIPEADIITAVLDLEEVKSYHCQGVVAFPFPINVGRIDKGGTAINWTGPVPVVAGSKRIGFASLSREADLHAGPVFADLFLTRESPERLDLEGKLRAYYIVAEDVSCVYFGGSPADVKPPIQITIKALRLTPTVAESMYGGLEAVW